MLLILAPSKEAMASREWSLATCHMLGQLAEDVTVEMARQGYPGEIYFHSEHPRAELRVDDTSSVSCAN